MIQIDGAEGEGGGQMLRSALTLSVLTGRPIRMIHIRAGRSKPGLAPQHLAAVEAAATISHAHLEGAVLGSQSLVFEPRVLLPGEYRFDIGTAGAAPLVLQTIALPLSFAEGGSRVEISGGTHVPWSPCYHYLEWHWLHYMERIGFPIKTTLEAAGFYPRGGGRMSASIQPATSLSTLELTERGPLERIRGLSAVANLDLSIARRQERQALRRLERHGVRIAMEVTPLPSRSKGTLLLLMAEFAHSRCCYYALGEPGKPAERVADEAVDALEAFLATDAAVDAYLADQLILPLSFVPGVSELSTAKITSHLVTHAGIVKRFVPVEIEIIGEIGQPGQVRIKGVKHPKRGNRGSQ